MAEKITAYFLRSGPDGPYRGYAGEIRNSLKELQRYVGGLIQAVHLTQSVIVICNDEGKLQQLPINRARIDNDQVIDYFVGNILCVRHSGEEFASIEPEDIEVIERCLVPLKSILQTQDHNIAFVMYPAEFCPEWPE